MPNCSGAMFNQTTDNIIAGQYKTDIYCKSDVMQWFCFVNKLDVDVERT